jgi:murein DD-endopeptidase MepM/ murein hydrolase activator NlpD
MAGAPHGVAALQPARQNAGLVLLIAVLALPCVGCGGSLAPAPPSEVAQCGPYPDQATSPYVLPYPVGDTHRVFQGNCSNISHLPDTIYQYAYDFSMTMGSPVVAAAPGRVVKVVQSFPNSTRVPEEENYIVIRLSDGKWSHYSHLDQNGAFVEVGQDVQRGQLIARSGASGTSISHLHFQVYLSNGMTVPVTFRNTRPHPNGLIEGESYAAEPY